MTATSPAGGPAVQVLLGPLKEMLESLTLQQETMREMVGGGPARACVYGGGFNIMCLRRVSWVACIGRLALRFVNLLPAPRPCRWLRWAMLSGGSRGR